MRATVVGLGAVGLVTAVCLASDGQEIVGLEADDARLASLRAGRVPFHEPDLEQMVAAALANGRLRLTGSASAAVASAELVIVAVGTHGGDGDWQTTAMARCLAEVVPLIADDAALVVRSTLPPEFVTSLALRVTSLRQEAGRSPVPVLLNPEFMREGNAVRDFRHPSRIVIGVASDPRGRGVEALRRLYRRTHAPVIVVPAMEAALGKLAANLFLATRISFANELAAVCDQFGADVDAVTGTMAPDPRIGGSFLRAGVGFGGSCLPSQVAMMSRSARERGVPTPLLDAVSAINDGQVERFAGHLSSFLGDLAGTRVALLGLAFKPATDDLRDAPSLRLAQLLLARGVRVVAYDPMPRARDGAAAAVPGLQVADAAEAAVRDADAVGLVTEWAEFASLDWAELRKLMRRAIVVDGRNALDAGRLIELGFAYAGFGRRQTAESFEAAESRQEVDGAPVGAIARALVSGQLDGVR